jgi:hypothetical protein
MKQKDDQLKRLQEEAKQKDEFMRLINEEPPDSHDPGALATRNRSKMPTLELFQQA